MVIYPLKIGFPGHICPLSPPQGASPPAASARSKLVAAAWGAAPVPGSAGPGNAVENNWLVVSTPLKNISQLG